MDFNHFSYELKVKNQSIMRLRDLLGLAFRSSSYITVRLKSAEAPKELLRMLNITKNWQQEFILIFG